MVVVVIVAAALMYHARTKFANEIGKSLLAHYSHSFSQSSGLPNLIQDYLQVRVRWLEDIITNCFYQRDP